MRFLSLFSGIEAASVAWKPLGWTCVGVAEIEPFPSAVLKHHYPDVPNLGDVTKVTEEDVKVLGPIDIVIHGSPCQDLSVAGKRKGLEGERSGLFYTGWKIVEWARKNNGCRFSLWENVPGAFSSNKGRDFTEVVGTMAGLPLLETPENGWANEGLALGPNGLVEWATLDAQWFGVAQRRRRVFALTDFGDWSRRPPILLESKSLRGDSPPCRKSGEKVAGTFTARARSGGWGHDVDLAAGHYMQPCNDDLSLREVSHCLNAGGMGRQDYESETLIPEVSGTIRTNARNNSNAATEARQLIVEKAQRSNSYHTTGMATWKEDKISGVLRAKVGGEYENLCIEDQAIPINTQLATRPIPTTDKDGFGIGEDGDPAFTLTRTHSHAVFCKESGGAVDLPVVFQQNQRDEVRILDIPGALAAQPGMKQQNYIVLPHKEEDVADTLRSGGDGGVPSSRGENLVPMIFQGKASARQSMNPSRDVSPTLDVGKGDGLCVMEEVKTAVPDPTSALRANPGSGFRSNGTPVESVVVEKYTAEVAPTLSASGASFSRPGGNSVVDSAYVAEKEVLPSSFDYKSGMGSGLSKEVAPTLRSMNHDKSHLNGGGHVAVIVREDGDNSSIATPETHPSLFKKEKDPETPHFRVRRLTVIECERLQGFPDDYLTQVVWKKKTPPPDGLMYKALGNSMAVPVIRWIGESIVRALNYEKKKKASE